jgi:4-hydroxy-tetrahydrodipicolinate synthase
MKKKIAFSGVSTALITPFKDGEIDYPTLDALIERQISSGIDALVIGGTTGEAATLSESERYALYEHSAEVIGGRTKLIFGTGTNDTQVAVKHTKFAARLACDAALVVTPYYNKGTEEGIFRHYSAIAECSRLPIILYNVPSRTGVNLGLNLLARLAENERIVGLKEASDSLDRMVALAELGEALPLYAGNDSQIYPTLSLGGVGAVSVVSNISPMQTRLIYERYKQGENSAALEAQLKLLPLIRALFLETNPSPLKCAMASLGLCEDEVRLPLDRVRESTYRALDEAVNKLTDTK